MKIEFFITVDVNDDDCSLDVIERATKALAERAEKYLQEEAFSIQSVFYNHSIRRESKKL